MVQEFRESRQDTTGLGPDFPGSSGDRERGKFRPSGRARLTLVAVANDDGSQVAGMLLSPQEELLLYTKAMVLGLSLLTDTDLLKEVG